MTPTIQAYGIRVEFLDYYNEDIEQLIRDRKDYGKVEVRRNPLDVREIFLLHPVREEWIIVPCREFHFPIATIKELKESRREAKRLGRQPTAANLAAIIADRQTHLDGAQKKTKSAARQAALAANNRKMRLTAPKVFGEPAPTMAPVDEGGADAKPAAPKRPLSGRALAALSQKPGAAARARSTTMTVDEDFAGSAAALADISDDEIDRLLDGN